MPFSVLSLRDPFGVSVAKVPIDTKAVVSYVLPPVVLYFTAAALAVMPRTHTMQVALWLVMALLALRAAVSVDMSLGNPDQIVSVYFVTTMLAITLQVLFWMLARKPLVRHFRPRNSPPSTIVDALDLALNIRGFGWDWSRGLYVPCEARPTNRIAFAFHTLFSGVVCVLMNSCLSRAIQTLTGVGPGVTIYDDTLPIHVRHLRACVISALCAFTAHTGIQTGYDAFTLLGVLLGQDPARWPPAFDSPWRATSLSDFWGRRWHQFYRHMFLSVAYPFTLLFGRAGGIVGAFLASALCHHVMMLTFDGRSELGRMLVGFGMMALGVLAERAFRTLTGRKVGGVAGWAWTMTWLFLWGNVIVDGFVRGGMFARKSASGYGCMSPWMDDLAKGFDAWLHTISVDSNRTV